MSTLLVSGLGVSTVAAPASATVTTLCSGYTACAGAGMSNSGYSSWRSTMYWRMYSGHNCTNYAAYRMVQAGLPNSRPWTGSGNATNWGSAMSRITNGTPSVGAIAWWKAGVRPAGSAGHVGYVEKVVSADEVIISQDSWNGDFSWTRITRTSSGWPSGFIHFSDVRVKNTAAPTVKGAARVGSVLAASPGVWSPSSATVGYQWLQDGVVIAGATAPTLTLKQAQQGRRISVKVSAASPGVTGASVVSAATAVVSSSGLQATTVPTIVGEPRVDSTLTADPGTWAPAPDSLAYQWRAGGAVIAGATSPTLVVDPSLVGKAVSVTVTAGKVRYTAASATSVATAPIAAGTLELPQAPSVRGRTEPGETLALVLPTLPPRTTASVQWFRGDVAVPDATGSTYALTSADLGSRMLAQVRLTRPNYAPLTRRTHTTAVVRATPVIRVTTVAGVRTLSMTASVRAAGVRVVNGTLRVRSRGKLIRAVPVNAGRASARITGLPRGARTYRFWFRTTPTVSRGVVARRLTIR